jgi:hypothetical protein
VLGRSGQTREARAGRGRSCRTNTDNKVWPIGISFDVIPRSAGERHGGRAAPRRSALKHVIDTFFEGSTEKVVVALLGGDGARLSEGELERIVELVTKARKEGSR